MKRALIGRVRRGAKLAGIAEAVDGVVKVFGDCEEFRVAVEHKPSGIDTSVQEIAK
jgi:hypothetical protein